MDTVIENNDIDVTIITESWLSVVTFPTSNISVGLNTTTFRKDRISGAGGVVAFVKNYLPTKS